MCRWLGRETRLAEYLQVYIHNSQVSGARYPERRARRPNRGISFIVSTACQTVLQGPCIDGLRVRT